MRNIILEHCTAGTVIFSISPETDKGSAGMSRVRKEFSWIYKEGTGSLNLAETVEVDSPRDEKRD